ncbi:DPY30 domain-containing protein 1 isoform X2 [Erinaceus europaeus]|uniref:DPY30 domain-containing protein 1 isoform X2 n=1 Tax=Erinaceus europaeus TaxID=9365 RepID=A0ABM3XLS5_ERIEU|nr:DPY30 domain-containing protein 1 isoform X2 [Erinaceus europaeus]
MESYYLQRSIGACLVQGLAELGKIRPLDPIEYLSLWISKYKKNVTAEQLRQKEMIELAREREIALMEKEMMERLKAEELMFQQMRMNIENMRTDDMSYLEDITTDPGKTLAEISDRYGAPNLSRVEELDEPNLSDVALNIDQDL